jgi:hypothetical protein
VSSVRFRAQAVVEVELEKNQLLPSTELGAKFGHPANFSKAEVLVEPD